ncbi:MAG: hypothetical protein Q9221_007084 [Calogaya cf. arnoldii]
MVTSLISHKGAYDYHWRNNNNASSASAPRTVPASTTFNPTYPGSPVAPTPVLPPAQPMEPYGARNIQSQHHRGGGQYVYTNPQHGDTNVLAHSFSQLSTTGYGGYSQSFAAPPRTSSVSQEEFYVRHHPQEFFVEGKVFIKLHTEDAGSNGDHSSFGFSTVAYEELAYSQLRRFVVVKARPKEYYCLCVPILTYRGKGATKKIVDKSAHAIIYTGSSAPEKLPDEQGMNKNPLRVIPVRADEKLDTRSRVNLGKTYPVEWNTKVKEIGRVEKASLVKLLTYWKLLMNG